MSSNGGGTTLLALLTGAAIGAAYGILYAPDKGSETRKKIMDKAEATKEDIAQRIAQAAEEINQTARVSKDDFERQLEVSLSDMSYKAEDVIKTLELKLAELREMNARLQKEPGAAASVKPKPTKS